MALTITVTNAGRAALVNAANTGTAPVTIAEVGLSATAVAPSAAATTLPDEFKRLATLSGDVVSDDTIHLVVRDEGADVFTVRSLALYLADGTLFAIYGQADVLVEKSAQAMMLIALDVQFADIDATELTFGDANFLNPPATTTTQGVVELATVAEAQAGIDALRALTPATAKAAILGWLLTQDGAGSGIDADLLDGQHGSYYSDIPGRLGFTPVNKAGDAMTGLLTLSGDPTAAGHAARKSYVDALVTAAAMLTKLVTVDGAGSGLDADLLDGQQGAYYTDIPSRLGFNPLNALSYTAADVRGKLVTVDGSGSGIDADLLDGQEGSYYRDLSNSTGTLPNARLSGLYTGVMLTTTGSQWMKNQQFGADLNNSDIVGVNGIFFSDSANVDGEEGIMFRKSGANDPYDMTSYDCLRGMDGALYWSQQTVWHSGNDGSGSGMDADLLDGQHGSYYRDLSNSTGTLPNARISGDYDGIGTLTAQRGRFTSSSDAAPGSTNHGLQVGPDTGVNVAVDGNEMMARNNGEPSALALNFDGGDVTINASKAWAAVNDGSGSGLDADLLDGQHGSWYMQAIPGQIGIFAMSSAPSGYLACNGAAVSRTTYAALFAAIGTTYGAGNGSTTFNLPDARGEFMRGWDNGRGVDAGRAIGSTQTSMVEEHEHFIANTGDSSTNLSGANVLTTHGASAGDSEYQLKGSAAAPTLGKTSSYGGAETRPRNIAFLVCIKT